MKTFAKLRRNSNSTWLLITVIGLLLILAAALGGLIQKYLNGEEFLIYHYANNLPHFQAWLNFFLQFGRPIEGFYWTYQYKLLGFNPLLLHSLSFVLLLIMSILAAACFLNAWPQSNRSKALPYMFVFLLFTSWVSASSVFRLSYDNGRISLIFFFLAGLVLQRWAVGQRGRWLVLSFAFFLLSVLTYENAAFLFPALLLLAWPLLPERNKYSVRNRAFFFAGLAAVSGFILLIPHWLYSTLIRMLMRPVGVPAMNADLGEVPMNVFGSGPATYLHFGQFGDFSISPLNLLVAIGLVLILSLASLWIVRSHRGSIRGLTNETRSRWICIYFASLWFLIFGPLPYVLLGYDVGGRVYSSAVYGVFPLMLMVYETVNKRHLRIVAVALILLFAGFGLFEVKEESIRFNHDEAGLNIFYRSLKDAVPFVKQNTVFIFINGPGGYSGCGASLEMLYDQNDLKCIIFSSTYSKYQAIRHPTEIEAGGQHLSGENWILLTVTDNVSTVLDELRPGDFDLLITWESMEPLTTDYKKIVTDDIPPPSAFYLDLLQRAKVLFPQ
jgi:hypothetical protein